jgi:hypothetical protein
MSDDLARFIRATVEHVEGRGPNPNAPPAPAATYGGGDEGRGSGAPPGYRAQAEPEPDDDELAESADDEESEYYEAPGATAQEAWDALSDAEQQAALNNPKSLDDWSRALAEEQPAEQGDDEIRSGRDFVGYVLSNTDANGDVEMEDGSIVGAQDYLATIAAMSAAEWHSWAAERGWDPEIRPAETDWPRDLQSASIADRFSDRLAKVQDEIEARKLDPTKTVHYW